MKQFIRKTKESILSAVILASSKHSELKDRWIQKYKTLSTAGHKVNYQRSFSFLTLSSFFFLMLFCMFPEYSFGIDEIGGIKDLTKKVQDETQGSFIPMVLNIAGIATAGFALITQKWIMLVFYLEQHI